MPLVLLFVEAFINVLMTALQIAILARVLLSWMPAKLPWGLGEFVYSVTEPILAPIRRAMPFTGGFDFSPLIALIGIQIVASILLRILPPTL